jgi:GDPmannose 4,6-dehydratase
MVPTSPYGAAKAFSINAVRIWREAFDLFAVNAICYNHESPRRGLSFVTRKIAYGVAQIAAGHQKTLALGNLDTERDWGYAPEYVEAMWRMLQAEQPSDLILATGNLTSLETFLEHAFSAVGLDWRNHVHVDPRFVRPTEPIKLVGDPSGARAHINWQAKVTGPELAELMVRAEMSALGIHL